MPRRSKSRIAASEWQAGPIVQMIFARRAVGLEIPAPAGAWLFFNFLSSWKKIILGRLQHLLQIIGNSSERR
jgi:hypothetical protein